jgi:LytR cell envelope-related transcriptional attenuator
MSRGTSLSTSLGRSRGSQRVRDERGVVLPTRLLALCVSVVAVAGLVFVANDPDKPANQQTATPADSKPSPTPTESVPTTTPEPSKPAKPVKPKPKPIKRGEVFVEVFNNTRTKGLAGGVAENAKAAGWNVVGSDNWYGTVDGTSVYFPPRLKQAARELGRDLGIKRLRPAEEPMQFDRVTVILTDDYS